MKFIKEYTKVILEPYIKKVDARMLQLNRVVNFTCEISFSPHKPCEIKSSITIKSKFESLIPNTDLCHEFILESKIVFESEHITFSNKELYQIFESHFKACQTVCKGLKLVMPNPQYHAQGLHVDYGSQIYQFVEDHKDNLEKWLSGTDCESLLNQ